MLGKYPMSNCNLKFCMYTQSECIIMNSFIICFGKLALQPLLFYLYSSLYITLVFISYLQRLQRTRLSLSFCSCVFSLVVGSLQLMPYTVQILSTHFTLWRLLISQLCCFLTGLVFLYNRHAF